MVEAAQVIPWWFDSQIWANIATVATGITAIVMVVFSGIQLKAAREEKRKAHDALVAANEALDRSQILETSLNAQINSSRIYTILVLQLQKDAMKHSGFMKETKENIFDKMIAALTHNRGQDFIVDESVIELARNLLTKEEFKKYILMES